MLPPSSSTFSSDRRLHRRLRGVMSVLGWTLLALVTLDLTAGWAFRMPRDPRQRPGAMAQYFDYGRSIQGKLAALVGPDDAHSAPIIVAGWIDRECRHVPLPPAPAHRGITIYGMSFTNHIADQLARLDPSLTITRYSGPGAPPNHSLACFRAVQNSGHDPNEIQVLGVLASSLPRLLTLGGATTTFEQPQPFTFPRYALDDSGRLTATEPAIHSPADMRDPKKVAEAHAQLIAYDAFYDPLQFSGEWADHSVFLRLLRRAHAQAELRSRTFRLIADGTQFRPEIGDLLRAMLVSFIQDVRARGQRPVVILLQDRGSGTDSLARMLGPALSESGVVVIRSDELANVNDPRNFLPDGHFTPAVDRLIAGKLLQMLNSRTP